MDQLERLTSLCMALQKVERFNDVIGNPHTYESVYNQLLRIEEELHETLDPVWMIAEYDIKTEETKKEVLDGICDILVTSLGLIKKAESLGYDVFDALEAVCSNNESKYCENEEHAIETCQYYLEQGIESFREYSEKNYVWIVKRTSDLKLLKPVGFQSVELSEFLPKE